MAAYHHLVTEVEDFIMRFDLSPSTFGRLACRDPNLVFDLREGRKLRAKTVYKIRRYMARRIKRTED